MTDNAYWNGKQHVNPYDEFGTKEGNITHPHVLRAKQDVRFPTSRPDPMLGMLTPAYKGDVGYDLIAEQTIEIGPIQRPSLHRLRGRHTWLDMLITSLVGEEPPPSFGVIRTGVHVEMPDGYWGAILPRSSSNKLGMFVPFSVIDNGYRGELFPMVHNLSDKTIKIERGKKFAQFVMFPMVVLPLVKVHKLSESHRGLNGFGSTGG